MPDASPTRSGPPPAADLSVSVRLVTLDDAEALRTIYNREVESSTVTFDMVARTLDEQRRWIAEHSGPYPALVAVDDHSGAVIGVASLSPYRPRPAYATTVEDSVYVHHGERGRGVGFRLIEALVESAEAHGFHSIIARVVGDHEASIALHRRAGFEIVGREREVGRKFGRWLDVVLMQRML
jgi:phosphinothricin acetyltransferase